MRVWPALPTPGELVRLPLPCPPQLIELSGYTGGARLIALWWSPRADRAVGWRAKGAVRSIPARPGRRGRRWCCPADRGDAPVTASFTARTTRRCAFAGGGIGHERARSCPVNRARCESTGCIDVASTTESVSVDAERPP
jgi:hypothetical protein